MARGDLTGASWQRLEPLLLPSETRYGTHWEGEALGRNKGGFTTKVHLRAEGSGKLMTLVLPPGQRHESLALWRRMEQGAVKRRGRGGTRLRPRRVVGDKGYSSRENWRYLCRLRNRIERLINRLKQNRRLATRYEKRAVNHRAMWIITALLHRL